MPENLTNSEQNIPITFREYCIAGLVTTVTLMELLDTTILNTALPAISASFNTSVINLRMAVTSYLISLAIFIPISGWIADRFGPKRTILAAVALFTTSSVLCGTATSLNEFVLFRILQGVGGAMMTPVSRLILVRLFQDKGDQALQSVTSIVAIPIVLGPITGPLLGGYLTTHLSWRWIFYVNLPIGLLAVLFMAFFLTNQPDKNRRRFDLSGFLAAGTGLALVSFVLEIVEADFLPLAALAGVAVTGLILLTWAVRHSLKRENGIFDIALFRIPTFRTGTVITVFGTMFSMGLQMLIPSFFQMVFGMSAFQAGLITVWTAFGVVVMKPMIPRIFALLGYRRVLMLYPLLLGSTMISFRSFSPGLPHAIIGAQLFIYGLWLSFHGNVVNVIPYLGLPKDRTSHATSLQSMIYQLSFSLGITFSALLLHLFLSMNEVAFTASANREKLLAAFHGCFTVCGILTCAVALIAFRYR